MLSWNIVLSVLKKTNLPRNSAKIFFGDTGYIFADQTFQRLRQIYSSQTGARLHCDWILSFSNFRETRLPRNSAKIFLGKSVTASCFSRFSCLSRSSLFRLSFPDFGSVLCTLKYQGTWKLSPFFFGADVLHQKGCILLSDTHRLSFDIYECFQSRGSYSDYDRIGYSLT